MTQYFQLSYMTNRNIFSNSVTRMVQSCSRVTPTSPTVAASNNQLPLRWDDRDDGRPTFGMDQQVRNRMGMGSGEQNLRNGDYTNSTLKNGLNSWNPLTIYNFYTCFYPPNKAWFFIGRTGLQPAERPELGPNELRTPFQQLNPLWRKSCFGTLT